ncbi:MAG TPA: carboxypeptidase regulatory-like domain-containing protein [Bryobacteraceae bacterium]|jgi:protocatechuate 3,4-dioxygenase beta subunit|nr:carboxypeptidase regulatory-like domain-containing protein [Bryobacteraceae bacterium]
MKAILCLSVLLPIPGAAQDCSISGHIYSLSTGAPLKKVQVHFSVPSVNDRPSENTTTTDADGAFRFDRLPPGKYSVRTERSGYLMSSTPVACGASDVTIRMTPQGMIYGKVLDDDGEPVSGATVAVFWRTWVRGERHIQMKQNTFSQADGSFVLGNLATGSYYLSARSVARAPKGEASVENFFPNAPDARTAAPVNVVAGAELHGINLRIRSTRVYTIRGKAVNLSGEPVTGVPLILVSANETTRGWMSNSGTTAGLFEFASVAPGNYVIQAVSYTERNSVNKVTTHVPVTVGEEDVTDVHVTLRPGVEIPGIVKLDDAPSSQSFQVTLEPGNGGGLEDVAQVKNGAFELRTVAPTAYHIVIANMPDGYYIKSMRFAGRDVVRRELDLTSGAGGTLEIQLSAKPAAITGTVRDSNGDPAANAIVNVWTGDDPEVRQVLTDEAGRFTVRNLAPGEYHAVAWESIERGIVENQAFRASFATQSASVALQQGSQDNVDLKLIPKTAVDLEVAKLP